MTRTLLSIACLAAVSLAQAGTIIPPDIFGDYAAEPLVSGYGYSPYNVGSLYGLLFSQALDGTLQGSFSGSSALPLGGTMTVTSAGIGDFGVLGVSGTDTLTDPGDSNSIFGQDYSLFRDVVTITFGDLQGTGYIAFQVTADGSSAITGSGTVLPNMNIDVFGGDLASQSNSFVFASNGVSVVTSPLYSFQYGQQFNLAGQLNLSFWLGPGDGSASANFFDTATITGIEVFDSNMDPLTDWTAASESGTTYDSDGAVPEPASVLLVFGGLLLGASLKVRRQFGAQGVRC
jgi:hypothetical protein